MGYTVKKTDAFNYDYSLKILASPFKKFINWCIGQEKNKFLWLGISLFSQIGATLPLTVIAILFLGGNNFVLWVIVAAVNIPVLTMNLAAMPTKITLPFLFFGWLTQFLIIIYCLGFAVLH